MSVRRPIAALCAAAALAVAPLAALAQAAWPTKPITIIVPFAAGGGADPVARSVADAIGKRLGQNVLVDFVPGGNGTIGTQKVVRAAADGYTLVFTSAPPIVNSKLLMPNLAYDPERDLVPILHLMESPIAVMASAEFPPRTLKELVAYAKSKPGEVTIGVPGLGGAGHLATALIEVKENVKLTMVPYKGTGGLLPDMLGGRLNISADFPAAYVQHIAAGKVRVMVVLGERRVGAFPDVPTSAESGYPELKIKSWYGLFAPRGTPRDIVDKLNAVVNEYLASAEGKTRMEGLGYLITGGSPEDLAQVIRTDLVVLGEVVRVAKVTVQ